MMNVPPSTYIVISKILDIKTVGNVTRDIGLYSQVDLVSRIRGTVYVHVQQESCNYVHRDNDQVHALQM